MGEQSRIPFFIKKWTKVIFYMSLLILRIISTKPRRLLRKFWSGFDNQFEEENVRGQIVLITGATSGIGKELTIEFAKRKATVIMAFRNLTAAKTAIIEIRNQTFFGTLVPMEVDLASLESIRKFVRNVENKFPKIDIIILNAAVLIPKEDVKTEDGFEANFGVNYLSHFLLTNLLLNLANRAESARIVSVSSLVMKYGKINFDDLMKVDGKSPHLCCPSLAYASSKLANALFSQTLAKRVEGTNVRTYCVCPGIATTSIDRNINENIAFLIPFVNLVKSMLFQSANQASKSILYCAVAKECSRQTGELYRRNKLWDTSYIIPDDLLIPGPMPFFKDEDAHKLWTLSEKLVSFDSEKTNLKHLKLY